MTEHILILDFGSQVTQLIARRIREAGVYCEIRPYSTPAIEIERLAPQGVVLSGGPASLTETEAPRPDDGIYTLGIPLLGICYGQQAMCAALGGTVESTAQREFGRAHLDVVEPCALFDGVWQVGAREQVWMSHGDAVAEVPSGFRVVARTDSAPFAAIADDARHFYGIQFHPEVVHTPHGGTLLKNFARRVSGCEGMWSMASFRTSAIEAIRTQVGDGRVICGLSGGVDSSVAAVLLHEAIGAQLTCVFVDTGLMRQGEAEEVTSLFRRHYNIPLVHEDARAVFLKRLAGITEPEEKRKIIGATFIDVFEQAARSAGDADFLAQGTLYPDVIESVSVSGPSAVIKSHHNVGGLPERMKLSLVEPLRMLFKDEVRALGRTLGMPEAHRAPSLPRTRSRNPYSGRGDGGEGRDPATGRCDPDRGNSQRRPLRRHLAGFRGAAAGTDGWRDGRCAHLRACLRAPCRHVGRWHDRRLLPFRHELPRRRREPHRQRGEGHQPRGLRCDLETTGND